MKKFIKQKRQDKNGFDTNFRDALPRFAVTFLLLTGVSIFCLTGVNERTVFATSAQISGNTTAVETLEKSGTSALKIIENPPEITIYEEDISSSPYTLQPLTVNGETNPVYTSYNSVFTANSYTGIGTNGFTTSISKIPNSYAIEFTIDCSDFVFRTSPFFRISVDEGNGYEMVSFEGFTEGSIAWMNFKVSFSEKKQRNIRIELTNSFWGVYLRDTDTISKLERESNPKAVFIGTSITQGVYKYFNCCNPLIGYPAVVSDTLGFECMNNGMGGTGYLTAGSSTTYYDRLVYAVENLKPDIIFIEGGPNDVDRYENVDIVTEAERCHEYLLMNAPDTKLIIIGLYHHTGYEYLSQKHIDLNEKLREEALKYGIPYIDLLTGDTIAGDGTILTEGHLRSTDGNFYITGNGNTANPTENGNADVYVDSDNYHPSVDGYAFLGTKLSVEIEKILEYQKY